MYIFFDKIIVLDEGKIVAKGNPLEIKANLYYQAWIGSNAS